VSEAGPRPAFAPGSHAITAHGRGTFAFAGMSHEGSILATPSGIRPIEAVNVADLEASVLQPLLTECAEKPGSIEFLVLGTGARMAPVSKTFRSSLSRVGLRFEAMATGPALRVYNVMQSEGRRVAAALIAAP
jgi:uncharacterized protein